MPPGGSCVPCTISDMAIGLGLYCTGPAHRKITAGWVFFIINCRQIDREGTMYHTCALAVSPRQFAAHELPRWHKHYNLKVITLTIINIHEHPHKKENTPKETVNRLLCILIIYIQNEHIYIYIQNEQRQFRVPLCASPTLSGNVSILPSHGHPPRCWMALCPHGKRRSRGCTELLSQPASNGFVWVWAVRFRVAIIYIYIIYLVSYMNGAGAIQTAYCVCVCFSHDEL